jgi:hypothetical protein
MTNPPTPTMDRLAEIIREHVSVGEISECSIEIVGFEDAAKAVSDLITSARSGGGDVVELREALADLVSWFDGGPSGHGPWIIASGVNGADDAVEAARAALSRIEVGVGSSSPKSEDTHRASDGWVLVPKEPTPEMLEPFARVLCSVLNIDPDEPKAPHGEWPTWYDECQPLAVAFTAMLQAAPSPSVPTGDAEGAVVAAETLAVMKEAREDQERILDALAALSGEPVAWQFTCNGEPMPAIWPYPDKCTDPWLSCAGADGQRALYARLQATPATSAGSE